MTERIKGKRSKARREQRREEAEVRNAVWAEMSPAAQLRSLERRGHGHCAQAQQLRAIVEQSPEPLTGSARITKRGAA